MKFPKINEYDVALLAVIAWITFWVYPSLNFSAELNTVALYLVVPNFALVPILWALVKSKINAFLKVFLLFTSWFLLVLAVMVIAAKFGSTTSVGAIALPSSVIQPLMGATVLASLLASLKKPRIRWFNFVSLTAYWAINMPKSFSTSWTMFDPSKFFFGDFISFILPMILYLHLVELRRSESRAISYLGKHIKGHRKIRVFRFGHFGAYILLITLGVFLTLDLFFLKLFRPSPYLLTSIELTSPMAWLLLALVTVAILILIPVATVAAGQKIKRLISRRRS